MGDTNKVPVRDAAITLFSNLEQILKITEQFLHFSALCFGCHNKVVINTGAYHSKP